MGAMVGSPPNIAATGVVRKAAEIFTQASGGWTLHQLDPARRHQPTNPPS